MFIMPIKQRREVGERAFGNTVPIAHAEPGAGVTAGAKADLVVPDRRFRQVQRSVPADQMAVVAAMPPQC